MLVPTYFSRRFSLLTFSVCIIRHLGAIRGPSAFLLIDAADFVLVLHTRTCAIIPESNQRDYNMYEKKDEKIRGWE